jgi:hypothetical protein
MAYQKIQRYQRLSPDIQTEWGTYTNPHMLFEPDEYRFRQPAAPLLAQGRSDVIYPARRHERGLGQIGGLGYVGEGYIPAPMGKTDKGGILGSDTLKTLLVIAAIGLVIYLLTRQGAKENPDTLEIAGPDVEPEPAPKKKRRPKRCGLTRDGRKRLSNFARKRPVDPVTKQFLPL